MDSISYCVMDKEIADILAIKTTIHKPEERTTVQKIKSLDKQYSEYMVQPHCTFSGLMYNVKV